MDKSWLHIRDRGNLSYIKGIDAFLEWAFSQPGVGSQIRCPCRRCMNVIFKGRRDVRTDLLSRGFWNSYTVWDLHGEIRRFQTDCRTSSHDKENATASENFTRMICDAYGVPCVDYTNTSHCDSEEPNLQAKRFFDLLKDAETELYPGCVKMSKLSFIVKLLQVKCLNHWSNKSMDVLLGLLKEVLPEGALVPTSFYEAKKIIRDLGLDYHKIDACENDCILYWGEHTHAESCPKCKMPIWNLNKQKGKKVPHKVLRHFPITPRLQRLYMSTDTAKEMRWHKEKHSNDEVMRHPADSLAWKHFDNQYPNFSADPRSVRLGLASDGIQPFGNMSANHSIWPVVLVPYNFPPWLCMKSPYFMMTLLIPGPKCPGDEIDVYLQPMIQELKQLWEVGVQTYDVYCQSNFIMHAAILWTINDFPAYGNLSGWSTKGKLACPCCHKDTHCISIRNKLSYMGHRRFLPQNHPWRKNKVSFDGKEEHMDPPVALTGDEVLKQFQHLGDVTFGKGTKRKRHIQNNAYNWRKRSIFFQLPYWKYLLIRHNLDVMHIERNVSQNIVCTVMDLVGKTKDTVKSRYDLMDLGIRSDMHPVEDGDNVYIPLAPYTLSPENKESLLKFLANVRVPDTFSSNISRCVNIQERKLFGLKSHDHHVLLQEIFPIAIRGLLPSKVCEPIIELGRFFKNLCSKSMSCEVLDKLQSQIILTLCKLETIFPPAFFDVMVHLPIHLAREAKVAGPVQYRWMYPIERFLTENLPTDFNLKKAVAIDLKWSNLTKVWEKSQVLELVKILNLSHSHCLTKIPDFSKLPYLEKLILKDCPRLSMIHPSIGKLRHLNLLNLKDCNGLEHLPRSVYDLKSLRTLNLFGCSKIEKLDEDIEKMESLTVLVASQTAITQIPKSLVRLKNIKYVSLCGYEVMSRDVFPSLILSWMPPTNHSKSLFQAFGVMPSLIKILSYPLFAKSREVFEAIPRTSQVSCKKHPASIGFPEQVQKEDSETFMSSITIRVGEFNTIIDTLLKSISQGCNERGFGVNSLPGDNYPHWRDFKGEGSSIFFEVPQTNGKSLKGLILCVIYNSSEDNMLSVYPVGVLVSNHTKGTIKLYKKEATSASKDEDNWQDIISNLEPGNRVQVIITFACVLRVKNTVVYLVYDEAVSKRIMC